jgi:ABC-2 type transport system ATP-binding protein
MDARQNLAFFGTLYDVPASELDRRVDRLLHEFGLSERAADKVGTYSKGMRQRLAIARALLHDPQVLFLDEPTSGLDPEAARMVRETIRQQGDQQRTIFMCTHNLTEAQHLCQRVAVMDRGALRAVGTPQELARALWSTVNVAIELLHEPQVELLSALTALPFVRACQAQYRDLQLEIDHEDHIADLVLQLASAGARIYAVRPQEHTLEDIYFKIQESAPAPAPTAKGGGQPCPEGRA